MHYLLDFWRVCDLVLVARAFSRFFSLPKGKIRGNEIALFFKNATFLPEDFIFMKKVIKYEFEIMFQTILYQIYRAFGCYTRYKL